MSDAPVPGWYPDPSNGSTTWRWWSGARWTDETAPRTDVRRAADWGAAIPLRSGALPVSTSTSTSSTVWLWILAFSIYVFGIPAGIVEGVGLALFGTMPDTLPLIVGAAIVLGMLPLLVFADLDGRALRRLGHPAPSPLWMLLLPPLAYFIARRATLRGADAPARGPWIAMWVVLGATVVPAIILGAMAAAIGIPYYIAQSAPYVAEVTGVQGQYGKGVIVEQDHDLGEMDLARSSEMPTLVGEMIGADLGGATVDCWPSVDMISLNSTFPCTVDRGDGSAPGHVSVTVDMMGDVSYTELAA